VNQPRILQVAQLPVFDLGGLGKVVQWLVADVAKNYRVSLAAPDAETPGMPDEVASHLENRISIPPHRWDPAATQRFLDHLKAERYDLIHFHGGTFAFDAHRPWRSPLHRLCLAGTPWVFTNHNAPALTEGLFSPDDSVARQWIKTAVAWSSKCCLLACCRQEVYVSDENRAQIGQWFPWAKSKMRTIYSSGLEGTPSRPVLSPEVVTIANLGHFGRRKGQHELLKAFILVQQKFPRLRLVLAGPQLDADYTRQMQEEISRRKLEAVVQMPGGLTDKTAFWQAVDVFVQPSLHEGLGMALMEALWLGKPAIGTRVGGIPEMIHHEVNGLLVEPGHAEQMAAAIERLVVESDTRRRFSEKAIAHIQAMGMTRAEMSRRCLELYDMVLAHARPQ
jgi:glycosyltransferase involved in cell wall biosynthesis